MFAGFSTEVEPDGEAFVKVLAGEQEPQRVHFAELFLDREVQRAVVERFGLCDDLERSDPRFNLKRDLRVQRFLGYDYVRVGPASGLGFPRPTDLRAADTAPDDQSKGERRWTNESLNSGIRVPTEDPIQPPSMRFHAR